MDDLIFPHHDLADFTMIVSSLFFLHSVRFEGVLDK